MAPEPRGFRPPVPPRLGGGGLGQMGFGNPKGMGGLGKRVSKGLPFIGGTWLAESIASTGMDIARTHAEIQKMNREPPPTYQSISPQQAGITITELPTTNKHTAYQRLLDEKGGTHKDRVFGFTGNRQNIQAAGFVVGVTVIIAGLAYVIYSSYKTKPEAEKAKKEGEKINSTNYKAKFIKVNAMYAECLDEDGNIKHEKKLIAESLKKESDRLAMFIDVSDIDLS